tara:strand:+ start:765 stop:1217 length:453 start_codon:yes stop_codon:yes gene_type:complete
MFIEIAESKGYIVHKPNFGQKKNNIDLILEGHNNKKPTKVTVDIKKKNSKNANKWVWIEYETSKGKDGWIYGSAQFIVFETSQSFIFVNRTKLLNWLSSSQMVRWDLPYVSNPWSAKYRLYRRTGNLETITQIQVEDLLNVDGVSVWKKF